MRNPRVECLVCHHRGSIANKSEYKVSGIFVHLCRSCEQELAAAMFREQRLFALRSEPQNVTDAAVVTAGEYQV